MPVLAVLALLGMLAASSGKANAVQLETSTGCVNVQGAAITNGTPVVLYACNAEFNELWEYANGQFFGLGTTNGVTRCLDIKGDGTAAGTKVDIYTCNGSGGQQWEIFPWTTSNVIYNPQSGLCLDSSAGNLAELSIEECTGSTSQTWSLY
jgi:hypothetical protein